MPWIRLIVVRLTMCHVLAAISLRYNLTKQNCQSGYVKCELGENFRVRGNQCVEWANVCDGELDCTDGSDEKYCPHNFNYGRSGFTYRFPKGPCPSTQRLCRKRPNDNIVSGCLNKNYICDKNRHCTDNSDELFCPYNKTTDLFHFEFLRRDCREGYVKCDSMSNVSFTDVSKHCIKKEWICDGNQDCIDGSDEKYCPYFFDLTVPSTTFKTYIRTETTVTDQVSAEPSTYQPPSTVSDQLPSVSDTFHYLSTIFHVITVTSLIIIIYFLYRYRFSNIVNPNIYKLTPINKLIHD